MSYIALKTRGVTTDYVWQFSAENASSEYAELESLTDEKRSISVIKNDLGYSVYFGGIETNKMDRIPRVIRVSVAFCGLDEHQARSLVVFAIRQPDTFRDALCATVNWDSVRDGIEWTANFNSVRQIRETAISLGFVMQGQPAFDDAWERFYTPEYSANDEEEEEQLKRELAKSSANLERLANELKCSSFTSSGGIKLLISRSPSPDGYERAKIEADRLLWSGGEERDLSVVRSKKKAPSARTTSAKSNEPSKTHSGGTSLPPSCPSTKSFSWMNSNKGLVIICGVVAMGILLGITCKKKVPEPEKIKRAPTAVPATGETQKSAGKIVSPASDEKAVTPSKSDEKTTLEPEESKDSPVKEKTKEP